MHSRTHLCVYYALTHTCTCIHMYTHTYTHTHAYSLVLTSPHHGVYKCVGVCESHMVLVCERESESVCVCVRERVCMYVLLVLSLEPTVHSLTRANTHVCVFFVFLCIFCCLYLALLTLYHDTTSFIYLCLTHPVGMRTSHVTQVPQLCHTRCLVLSHT